MEYDDLQFNNSVNQGLSSSLFTNNQQNVFNWMGPEGSDCGVKFLFLNSFLNSFFD
jgi:hypothetical protein